MVVLAYLVNQYKIPRSWVDVSISYVLLFGVDVISPWIKQRNSLKFCATLRKSVMETMAIIRQVFKEKSMSHS
jgi:hypothetical protein